jgi:isopenicillin-N epimerase
MKDLYLLDPDITFLNHGSFGACPKPVFDAYQNWQRKLENQPVQFMAIDVYEHLALARNKLGAFIGCDGDDLFFIPNATTAVNTIIRSLDLGPGDEVLSTNHEYGSLIRAWEWVAKEKGFHFIQHEFPLPLKTHEDFIEDFWESVTANTRIIFVSHITSSTGLIFPAEKICSRARKDGILTIIDGAHVPGQLALDITAMDPDVYTGACHKWLSAPKGSTFLYVKNDLQSLIKPLIISWGEAGDDPGPSQFLKDNQYQGTRDPSAFLAVPAAIDFQKVHNWNTVKKSCRELNRRTRDRSYKIIHTDPICPNTEEWLGQMASVEVDVNNEQALKDTLLETYKIEIPVFTWQEKTLLRFSFNAYNDEHDADVLIGGLKDIF